MEGVKVLIVEDDVTFVTLIKLALKGWATEFHMVRDGKQALEALRNKAFDLVISDYRLPNTDGLEVVKVATQINPSCRTVLISASNEASLPDLEGLPRLSFIEKPFSPIQLRELVMQAF